MANLNRTFSLCISLVAIVIVLAACSKEPIYRQQSYVFGTLVEVTIWGENDARAQELIGKVLREFDRLHKELHAWQPSELTKVNDAIAKGESDQHYTGTCGNFERRYKTFCAIERRVQPSPSGN